jgi:sucrose-phosphate synthase
MAGNEWINGYLEAILSTGASTIEEQKPPQAALRDGGHFNPTKYFVEEVVASVDESDLYRTWVKVVATRNTRERSSRLDNMCWRIWHLARKKKQVLSLSLSLSKYIIYLLRVSHWLQDNLDIC